MGFAERLSQSCGADDLRSRSGKLGDVEHIAALSAAPDIGSDLMRARDYDVQALRRVIQRLAIKASRKLGIGTMASIMLAQVAVREVMHWQCRVCNGGAEVATETLKQVCPACGGSGVHRWKDAEREQAARQAGMTEEAWAFWERKYEQVLGIARQDDGETLRATHNKLCGDD